MVYKSEVMSQSKFIQDFVSKLNLLASSYSVKMEGSAPNTEEQNLQETLILNTTQVGPDFYNIYHKRFENSGSTGLPGVPIEQLSVKQRLICETVREHISKPFELQLAKPLRAIVIGQAGCGKSQVMVQLKSLLEARKSSDFDYKVVSFTGLSAHNIGGCTMHSCFRIPVYKEPSQWFSGNKRAVTDRMKQEFSNVGMILIDEFQMVSKNMFAYLDYFLRKIDPKNAAFPFANRSIILAGDIWQFPPVADNSIFTPDLSKKETEREVMAHRIYRREFRKVFVLEECFRQDAESEYFHFLCRLKRGECTKADVTKLRRRVHTDLSLWEEDQFRSSALAVFNTRAQAADYNMRRLWLDFHPSNIETIDGMRLARRAKIVVTQNLTVPGGVYNGSVGYIVDWVYEKDKGDGDEPKVAYIIVDLPSYSGSVFVEVPRGKGVPIFRTYQSELCETDKTKLLSFKRFPIKLFSGSTGHKAIGLTLSKIAVKLDPSEMFPAWTFVQLSRVKDFSSVMILDNFVSDDRFLKLGPKQQLFLKIVTREEQRLKNIENNVAAL